MARSVSAPEASSSSFASCSRSFFLLVMWASATTRAGVSKSRICMWCSRPGCRRSRLATLADFALFGRDAPFVVGQFFLVLLDLSVELVGQLVDRRVHVLVVGERMDDLL